LPSYASLKPNNPDLPIVQPILNKFISAEMCGTSPEGVTSIYRYEALITFAIADLAVMLSFL